VSRDCRATLEGQTRQRDLVLNHLEGSGADGIIMIVDLNRQSSLASSIYLNLADSFNTTQKFKQAKPQSGIIQGPN
jgi:hypothetical protein